MRGEEKNNWYNARHVRIIIIFWSPEWQNLYIFHMSPLYREVWKVNRQIWRWWKYIRLLKIVHRLFIVNSEIFSSSHSFLVGRVLVSAWFISSLCISQALVQHEPYQYDAENDLAGDDRCNGSVQSHFLYLCFLFSITVDVVTHKFSIVTMVYLTSV